MLDEHRHNQPIFTKSSNFHVPTQDAPREKTLAEIELEKHLEKEKLDSNFPLASLHVGILGPEAMDHAEKPALLSSQFHNLPLVKDPVKSVVPNDHLGE